MQTKPKVALQLVGSPTSQYFFDLSMLYASEVVRPNGYELRFVIAYPDGTWSISKELGTETAKMSKTVMEQQILDADLAVPHMFCERGMIALRIYFEDVLGIPIVGSSGFVMQTAQNKFLTKAIATKANVLSPEGILVSTDPKNRLKLSNIPQISSTIGFPCIVKPNASDNSDGLTMVKQNENLHVAIEKAALYDREVLIEAFVGDREIRGAVIERDDELYVLPFIEYHVSNRHPIREAEDKLRFDESGNPLAQSEKLYVPSTCPADLNKNLIEQLGDAVKKMHRALGCRGFSMYDFRIDSKTNTVYLLEAGLFWSFSPKSMISQMLEVQCESLFRITAEQWHMASSYNAK